jgi:hypothetical protein
MRRAAAVPAPLVGDRLVSFSVGSRQDLQALWCAGNGWDALFQLAAGRPLETGHGRALRPVDVRLAIHRPDQTIVRTIPSLTLAFPKVLLLPANQVLVVGNKCVWRPSGPERNVILYGEHSQVLADETWGDDICQLAVAADDTIWVGYSTMATVGTSNGWGGPGPAPPGWPGLVRYEPDGLRAIWHHPQQNPGGPVDSCYALNAANDGTWIYYYPGFPIVRITDRGITGWHNEHVKGAHALAVSYPDIALFGGYADADADLLSVGTLADDRVEIHQQYRVVLPDGAPIGRVTMIGRGPTLHTVIGDAWYQLSIANMHQPPR